MEKQEHGQIELTKSPRAQQIDPETGELYPWWVPDEEGIYVLNQVYINRHCINPAAEKHSACPLIRV